MKYRYPCTNYIEMSGFGAYLEQETKEPRYNIQQFSNELKARFNAPYITLTNSGSSANLVAALAMAEKIKETGKPLTAAVSAFTFPTTISSLVMAGFKPMIVDVSPDGFNMSLTELIQLDPLPSLIVPTHFLGFPCDIREIVEYAHKNGSLVLQDACETLGMKIDGVPVFAFGDITTWSFYHPHHMSSYGGGAVITGNQEDYMLVDSVAHWGRSCKCHIDENLCTVPEGPGHQFTYERLGVNVEISELNACFGRWQLIKHDEMEQKRQNNYQILFNMLCNNKSVKVWDAPKIDCSAFVFPVKLLNGNTIYDLFPILKAEGIEMRTLMGGVSNEQKAFKDILGMDIKTNAHDMALYTFFVGIHQTLPQEDVQYVAERLNEILK